MSKAKIYTRTGDKGKTSLYGGTRILKSNRRVSAYGAVDEVASSIGVLRAFLTDDKLDAQLTAIQDDLMTIGSYLADAPIDITHLPKRIKVIEQAIDVMDTKLPPLKHFTYAGGVPAASFAGLTRSITRRCEREVIRLAQQESVDKQVVTYLNRLSDYLFVVARYINHEHGIVSKKWKEGTRAAKLKSK